MNRNRLKLYIKHERELRKKHADMQMLIFGFFMFGLICSCIIFAVAEPDEGSVGGLIFTYFWMEVLAFKYLCESVYIVNEKNQMQSIFVKMLYVPRSMKEIFAAKALVMIKDMWIVIIITQLITVLINILYNGGSFVVYPETLTPLYAGAAGSFIQFMALLCSYRAAIKKS